VTTAPPFAWYPVRPVAGSVISSTKSLASASACLSTSSPAIAADLSTKIIQPVTDVSLAPSATPYRQPRFSFFDRMIQATAFCALPRNDSVCDIP
jgi:hypothetical protein